MPSDADADRQPAIHLTGEPYIPMSCSDSSKDVDVRVILQHVRNARVAVFGDFCIDAYWHLWEGTPEFSIETGLPVRRVSSQNNSLGGAGSVVANLREMGVEHVKAIGVAGTDAFGEMLRSMLMACGADTSGFVLVPSWQTMVYVKPYVGLREESRIDFGSFNAAQDVLVEALLLRLEEAIADCDVVILNQQISSGVSSPATIARINSMIARYPRVIFLVDSRHYQHHYTGASLKLNMSEAADLLDERKDQIHSAERAQNFALRISKRTGKPTFLTCGKHGIVVAVEGKAIAIPGLKITGPIDTVGAGDAVVAAVAAAMAGGIDPVSASRFANLVAMITVQKLKTTGTASVAEILSAAANVEYTAAPAPIAGATIGVVARPEEGHAGASYDE